MLSVGSRGDGRKPVVGLQFEDDEEGGVEMEENELEEGEACSGKEERDDDDDDTIDLDELSYIDVKLQNVLGHFQKDFEGGVCAENLGAKFGGYGSFLPAYQRSPSILSQSRSPHTTTGAMNGVNTAATYVSQSEVSSPQNITAIPSQYSFDNNNTATHASTTLTNNDKDALRKVSSNQDITPQHDSFSRSSNGSDQRTLKVRIKVGPESAPPRNNNAAIYSRLGINMSPSSSPEDSPEDSGGGGLFFTRGHDCPDTPLTTFKFYSSLRAPHLVPYLLSPIQQDLLFMAEKKPPIQKHIRMEANAPLRTNKNHVKSRSSNYIKGSKFSDIASNANGSGSSHVSTSVNHVHAKTSPRKERPINTLSPSVPPPPKCNYNYDNLARQQVSERSKDSSVSRRTEKTPLVKDEKPSPGWVDKEPLGITKFANGSTPSSKQKLSIDSGSDEKVFPSSTGNHGAYRDPQKTVKPNHVKTFNHVKTESDTMYAGVDDLLVGPAESVKLRAPQRTISYEEVGDLQEKDTGTGKKKKIKGSKSNHRSSKDKFKDDIDPASTAPPKGKKSNAVPTGDTGRKFNTSKSEKDPNRKVSKEGTSYTSVIKVDQGDHRSKLGDVRLDYEGGSFMPGDRIKERIVQKKPAIPLLPQAEKASEAAPVIGNEIAIDLAPPSDDFWVQCDKCQKWRLCPPGVKPEDLPHIWFCHMLDWLPGMNRCSISEEETTQAVRAPYQPLPPESQVTFDYLHYATTSGITSTDPQQPNQDLAKAHAKSKKPSHVSQNILEPNQHWDNSTYFCPGKQKHKNTEKKEWQEQDHHPNKGDSAEKGSKSMKLKSRKESDQDGMRTSKKLKPAESFDVKHDWHHNLNSSGERNSGAANHYSPEISTKYHKDNSLPKESRRSKLQLSEEMVKLPCHTTENIEVKEDYSNRSDTSKKRKVKPQHGSKEHPKTEVGIEIRKEATEALVRKEKKPRASKFDIRELNENKLTVESERNKPLTGTPLSGNKDEFHLRSSHDKQDADHAYRFSQKNANSVDNPRRDMGFSQTSTAATSSSSKISGSCRSKTNFQEARGSPVESVSSSPLRTSATGKLTRRVDDTRNLDMFSKGGTGEYFSDIDGVYHQKQKAPSAIERGKVTESRIANPVNETFNMTDKKTGPLSESKAQNILLSIFGHTDDDHSSEYEDTNVGVGAVVTSEPSRNVSGEFQVRSQDNDLKVYDDFRPDERNLQNLFTDNSCQTKEKRRNPEVDVSDAKRKLPVPASHQRDRNPAANDGTDAHSRPTYTESSRPDKYNIEKIEKKTCSTKKSGEQTKDTKRGDRLNSASGNFDVSGSSLPADKHRGSEASAAGTTVACGNSGKSKHNEKAQVATRNEGCGAPAQHDRMDKLDKTSGKSKKLETSLPGNKQELRDIVHQSVSTTLNESHSVPLPEKILTSTPVSLPKETGKSGNRNEAGSSSLMQLTPNRLDVAGSSKRDAGTSVTNILKEATDLKHTANRKKNEGLDHESTGLYFQAALKFLYGASLMERSNSESTKHGDPIKLYFQTAKLCEFCAYEYERRKEMAAAALAYKCTEVAYMKVVYLKNNFAIKDRHELQNARQIGESPSSSASDVDNVNNQGVLDKTAPDKKVNSLQGPQPAGGLVIASRNRSSFLQILSFVEATNCAMEASKKSIHSLSLATSTINEGKKGVEGLSSVQRTLDFCFHDIEGLLRLVRLAMEHISR